MGLLRHPICNVFVIVIWGEGRAFKMAPYATRFFFEFSRKSYLNKIKFLIHIHFLGFWGFGVLGFWGNLNKVGNIAWGNLNKAGYIAWGNLNKAGYIAWGNLNKAGNMAWGNLNKAGNIAWGNLNKAGYIALQIGNQLLPLTKQRSKLASTLSRLGRNRIGRYRQIYSWFPTCNHYQLSFL